MVEWTGILHISDNVFKSTAKAMLYPFSSFSMIVIAVLSCLGMLFSDNLYINEALFVLIWSLIASYAQNVLDHTIRGKNEAPKFTHIPINKLINHIFMVFKQSMIYLVAAALFIGSLQMNNAVLAYGFLAIFAVILPLGLMKSIITRKFKSFFDLAPFINVFKRTGAQYLVLMVLFIPVITIFHLYISYQPRLITPLICYLMIVIYRLLGQMILKCHKELNYSLNYEHFKDKYSLEALHGFKA